MMTKARNWRLWVGFLIALLAPIGYFSLFEITRAALWIALLLFVVAIALLVGGLQRAYSDATEYRGKTAGPILATLTLLIIGLFGFTLYMMKQAYPVAANAPRVGQKAPEFALSDSNGNPLKLTELLSRQLPGGGASRGVLLVFYRGYW